jgi:ABC-type branched-subunit amino acid transport system substrate-binding protein
MSQEPRSRHRRNLIYLPLLCLFLSAVVPNAFGEKTIPVRTAEERFLLGERMYREGVLPSGEDMLAFVKGDVPVSGTAFTCVSCHMRSGLGSLEGGVITTPTNGASLYAERLASKDKTPMLSMGSGSTKTPLPPPPPSPPPRPAYTDETLVKVLQVGVDPADRTLSDVMPRYLLEGDDMSIMVDYLKSLSARTSPGVDDTTLHLAMVISDDVPEELLRAVTLPLEKFLQQTNAGAQGLRKKSRTLENMISSRKISYRKLDLSRWVLKGPPETWRSQLEEYYRKQPVFALIGGMTTRDWRPVHEFAEANRIPCLLPQTDFPVISASDWYTLYFSKGLYQEGEGAARYLAGMSDARSNKPVIQLVRDSREGRALAAGFRETWQELGQPAAQTVTIPADEKIDAAFVQRLITKYRPGALLLWDGPAVLPFLSAATAKDGPGVVFLSSSYLGENFRTIPEQARERIYLTYPYRLPKDEARYESAVEAFFSNNAIGREYAVAGKKTYATIRLMNQALIDIKENYYRDYFLDVLSMLSDLDFPLYERMSFGPGQRYASKGCYIVQLSPGPRPELVRKSDWVIH